MLEGDEWKYAREPKAVAGNRAQRQSRANADYATGLISREAWNRISDELSEPAPAIVMGEAVV